MKAVGQVIFEIPWVLFDKSAKWVNPILLNYIYEVANTHLNFFYLHMETSLAMWALIALIC